MNRLLGSIFTDRIVHHKNNNNKNKSPFRKNLNKNGIILTIINRTKFRR